MSQNRTLVLASTSPYRAQALRTLGLEFTTAAPRTDETFLPGEQPQALALRLARAKAASISYSHPDAVVIGADQVGACDGRRLGKPGTAEAAVEQLCALSGRPATFYTAAVVADARARETIADVVVTNLQFRDFSRDEAIRYVDLDAPLDCAGSFKVEALGIALFESVSSSDPTALVGLPLISVLAALRRLGVNPLTA